MLLLRHLNGVGVNLAIIVIFINFSLDKKVRH